MKLFLPVLCLFALPACTTLENRRDLYCPQEVQGPYTRMLKEGIPAPEPLTGTVFVVSDGKTIVR